MANSLDGKKVLLVEDEYFIAADLARALKDEGAEVVGPAPDVSAGLALLDRGPVDAAVLDINLKGKMSYPLADKLRERAVPHLFVTGYDGWALPDKYRNTPRVAKPFTLGTVLKIVGDFCAETL